MGLPVVLHCGQHGLRDRFRRNRMIGNDRRGLRHRRNREQQAAKPAQRLAQRPARPAAVPAVREYRAAVVPAARPAGSMSLPAIQPLPHAPAACAPAHAAPRQSSSRPGRGFAVDRFGCGGQRRRFRDRRFRRFDLADRFAGRWLRRGYRDRRRSNFCGQQRLEGRHRVGIDRRARGLKRHDIAARQRAQRRCIAVSVEHADDVGAQAVAFRFGREIGLVDRIGARKANRDSQQRADQLKHKDEARTARRGMRRHVRIVIIPGFRTGDRALPPTLQKTSVEGNLGCPQSRKHRGEFAPRMGRNRGIRVYGCFTCAGAGSRKTHRSRSCAGSSIAPRPTAARPW